jgi:hypothetical protein
LARRRAGPAPAATGPDLASRRALGNDYLARSVDDWQEGPGGLPAGLRIGGPSDPAESQADLAAARAADMLHPRSRGSAPLVARRRSAGMGATLGTAVPRSVAEVLATPGRPLDPGTLERMARTTGDDLSAVRIHDDGFAAAASADVHAAAWTVGHHIAFADDAFRPASPAGDRLLAHELTHVTQQRRAGLSMLARSVDDWLQPSSRSLATMSYTDLVLEADDLQQWLNRQITSSPNTIRIEETLSELRREITHRDAQAVSAGRPTAHRPRRGTAAAPTPLPDRRPDVLTRMSSVAYTDPAEMRAQYDLIMQWLAVPQLAASERRILEAERANLSVLLQGERQRAVGERQATRLALALTPAQAGQGMQLGNLAAVIEGIAADPANPELFWIYDRGERIPISRAQRDSLHATLHDQLASAQRRLVSDVDYAWGRYQSQREVNADYPVISTISGWLGGVHDPGAELVRRRMAALGHLGILDGYVKNGRLREAGAMLAGLEHDTQIIRVVARAFYEGYIEGAERAVTVLEITRDVSFAVAASIGAVVAAPFVAGVVAGTGATGTLATGLTIAGTGTVVGTGTGLVRGGSAALGVGLAGGTAGEALAALRSEGTRGFVDGFVAGAGGSAARALAPALATRLGGQITARVATQMIINSGATVIDSLAHGASLEQAALAGATAAALSIPGGLVGGEGRVSRLLLGPLTNSGTAYLGAIANGASPDQARRAAITALATAVGAGGLPQGREDEVAGYYQAGRQLGATARSKALQTTAAVMIGVAQAAPPVRTVGGATTTLTMSQPAGAEQGAVQATPTAPTVVVPGSAQVALDVTPATPEALLATTPAAVAPPAAQQVTAPAPVTGGAAPIVSAASVAPSIPAQPPAPVLAPTETPAPAETPTPAQAAPTPAQTETPTPAAGPATAAPSAPAQGPAASTVAPNVETELGVTAAQRGAARGAFSGNLTSPANAPLGAAWNQVAVPGQGATLTAANSRDLFNLQRARFWRAVRRDPAALQVIRNMGGTFPEERNGGTINPAATSVPEINLPGGIRLRISLDHEIERQTAPNLALNPNNLRLSTIRENTVLLRQLHDQDPFINPPPDWTPWP